MKNLTLDKRYVYGFCMWHDDIHKAGSTGAQELKINGRDVKSPGLPCCPFCGSMLMEVPSIESWQKSVDAHDKKYPGYAKLVAWGRGKCFRDFNEFLAAYNLANNTKHLSAEFGLGK